MNEQDSRTPSLTNSECTLSSSGDNLRYSSPIKSNTVINNVSHIRKDWVPRERPQAASVHSNRTSVHSRSSAYYGYMNGFIRAWSNPTILAQMLVYIQWKDFQAVIRTCRSMRTFFFNQDIRDVTLARFIPGYHRVSPHDDVTITLSDLEILMASTHLSLSSYPKLAVDLVSRSSPLPKHQLLFDRFVRFTQVHSRFILFLRSQAPRWQYSLYTEEPIKRHSVNPSLLRELSFPPPLSYFGIDHDDCNITNINTPYTDSNHNNNNNNNNNNIHNITNYRQDIASSTPPSPKLKIKASLRRRPHSLEDPRLRPLPSKPRSSLFGHKDRPPPPLPQSSPPSLKYFSISRKRQVGNGEGQFVSHSRYISEALPPPRYPFASNSTNSLPASLGSSSTSSFRSRRHSPSPHELSYARSPMRAPILRVFVPCSSLTDESVLVEAEHQLISGDLWEHLRTGDAVLNLGYVPTDNSRVCGWLIFVDGRLKTYFPPDPLPVPDLSSLGSPFYYAHLSQRFNVRSFIRLPRMRLHLELIPLTSLLPSTSSPHGLTRVNHYAWIGKMYVRDEDTEACGLGDGWAGEWILESAGTLEGRQSLIDAVEGRTLDPRGRQWEIIGEKSGLGKLWLKMLWESKTADVRMNLDPLLSSTIH